MESESASIWATWLAPRKRHDFCVGERFIVGGMRLWLSGDAGWRIAVTAIAEAFGHSRIGPAAANMAAMFEILDRGARRDFMIYPPACDKVSADERALVLVLAAYQWDQTGLAERVIDWLVRPNWQDNVAGYCSENARACGARGLTLAPPLRRAANPGNSQGQIMRIAV